MGKLVSQKPGSPGLTTQAQTQLRCSLPTRWSTSSPRLDKDKLLPGQNWPRAIDRAIEISHGFIAYFSPRSIAKRGQFQSELRYALDCARRLPLEEPFVIPVRLPRCEEPRHIAEQVQYVDLVPDWDWSVRRLVRAARGRRGGGEAPKL